MFSSGSSAAAIATWDSAGNSELATNSGVVAIATGSASAETSEKLLSCTDGNWLAIGAMTVASSNTPVIGCAMSKKSPSWITSPAFNR